MCIRRIIHRWRQSHYENVHMIISIFILFTGDDNKNNENNSNYTRNIYAIRSNCRKIFPLYNGTISASIDNSRKTNCSGLMSWLHVVLKKYLDINDNQIICEWIQSTCWVRTYMEFACWIIVGIVWMLNTDDCLWSSKEEHDDYSTMDTR
jgi:hypothetical protein